MGLGRSEELWNCNLIKISNLSENIRYFLYTIWKIQKTRSQKKIIQENEKYEKTN